MAAPGVWGKLNLKDEAEIVVLNAPDSFASEIKALKGVKVRPSLAGVKAMRFALAFATKQKEVDALASAVGKLAEGDAVVWVAYPKGSSKKYTCEFNRDSGWAAMGAQGLEPVRMVAIDEDWSALRFRRVDYIKTMKRGAEHAISAKGKAKARLTRR
jgi:hypothetical protein